MRLAFYAGASTAAAAACLLKAFHERPNFYSATVYLSQSNACLLILTNLLLVGACSFMYSLQRLLYGPLRPIEIEQLSEKAWYAVLDTLLAMPSFREDVGGWLLTMFVLLLAGKVWGWIGEGRVDILEQQPPSNPRLFHARLSTSLAISVAFNAWMAWWCFETVVANPRPGMMVIFTFEFTIQIIFSTFTLLRYLLAAAEIKVVKQQTQQAIETRKNEIRAERAAARQTETEDGTPTPASPPTDEPIDVDENEVDVPGWEEKRRWLFVLEVVTDFLKLVVYIVFFTISVTFNGLPMHIMRDVYMTFASFSKRVNDYLNYRKATSDMNARYPDATTEEIRGDACIVCREDMVAWEQPAGGAQAQPAADTAAAAPAATPTGRRDEGLRAKKLPCGHILHLRCLKAWLERQQVCPTCRRPVIAAIQPTAPGQPGAPAANPAAPGAPGVPGAPGQQPGAQRPVRARFFNLGPVRIGFANGPPGQMNDIVNQLRNPNAQGGNQAAVQPAEQQGPNHLGLQVPYVQNGIAGGAATAVNGVPVAPGSRATVPVQIQLMQLEQRLMQEAHNLRLEQQQLGILRAMEGEMARLRAAQLPTQPPVGTDSAAQRSAAAVGVQQAGLRVPDHNFSSGFPQQMHSDLPSQQLLQGQVGQQMGSGHEHLPPGMVLPEGWSVMPLQRTEAMGAAPAPQSSINNEASGNNIQPPTTEGGEFGTVVAPSAEASMNGTAPPGPQQSQSPVSEQTTESQARGPTDEQGSPLFVPTAPTDSRVPAPSSLATDSAVPQSTDSHAVTTPATQSNTPWNTDSWGFGQIPDNHPPESKHQSEPNSVDRQDNQEQGSQPNYTGKGKGRAVEVEDAPDSQT